MRELFAVFAGAGKRLTLERKNMLWHAHTAAALERTKRLPNLTDMLARLDPKPRRAMTPQEIRASVFAMAKAMGAKIIRRKKKPAAGG